MSPIVNNINSNYNEINKKLNATNDNLNILKKRAKNVDASINKQNKEIGQMMRKNIIALRESVKKVFSRLIVQNKINKGVLKTTNRTKVLSDSLRKSLAKMPPVAAPVAAPIAAPIAAPVAAPIAAPAPAV